MRISRNALYLVGGSAMLMATSVLHIAQANLAFLNWPDFWITFAAVVGFSGLIVLIFAFVFPKHLSIAAAVGLVNWLSVYDGEIAEWLRGLVGPAVSGLTPGGTVLLLLAAGCPFLLIILSLLPRDLYSRLIGATGLALFTLAAVQLVMSEGFVSALAPVADSRALIDEHQLPDPARADRRLPDIIYIVPDRYGNSAVLANVFQHDNTAFVAALRQRGFVVADAARSNYSHTPYSLASTLNMQYLEAFMQRLGGKARRIQPLFSLIQDNLVTARLKQMGYRYVHVASIWDGTRQSAQADVTVDFYALDFAGEFSLAVLQQMPLMVLAIATVVSPDRCAALKRRLAYLEDVGGEDQPTFVFAHLLMPHPPILTDADGNCIGTMEYPIRPKGVTWDRFRQGFSGFVSYFNTRLLEIFDRQKANNPNPLIFVVQADEGPYPKAYRESILAGPDTASLATAAPFAWETASDAELATKFGILNALYLDGAGGGATAANIPEDLTPVNNWRVIFGRLDRKTYPLLPDRHFLLPDRNELDRLIEFTERLQAIAP